MNVNRKIGSLFILLALSSLLLGLLFGAFSSLQYVYPFFLKEQLSFQKTRPLHVYLVINWIFCAATGGIYSYLPSFAERKLFSPKLAWLQFFLQLIVLIIVFSGFFSGIFGGREYLEFPPWITILIILSWIFFMINFFATVKPAFQHAPVYIWFWSTGLLFFLITICEAQLWVLPFFNNNIIRDVTVQWKAMGSMVGSWNMLVYGTAIFLMEKITGDKKISRSAVAFFFYFLGLTNLMFNWGHHTYIVPASPVVKTVSYFISMTELLLLGSIIYSWRKSYLRAKQFNHRLPFSVLSYADGWVFLNLVLAIIISVPAINLYTHGTHITVAHAMGATIGINTLILLASLLFIAESAALTSIDKIKRNIRFAVILVNSSLLVFWISMIGMGLSKINSLQKGNSFYEIMDRLKPYFRIFSVSGIVLMAALAIVVILLLSLFGKIAFCKMNQAR
ncbi:MAG: cbb3-type cytochrome c oxidase subunit I [Chitinophagales bacterium]